jgi:hypothetical protein
VAYDGEKGSEAALRAVVSRTRGHTHGTIHVVMVVEAVGTKIEMPDGSIVERWTALDTLRITVAEMIRSWGNKAPGIRIAAHLRSGDEAAAVIHLAQQVEAEQIVVAAEAQLGASKDTDLAADILMESEIPVHVEVNAGKLFSDKSETIHAPRLFSLNDASSFSITDKGSPDLGLLPSLKS